MGGFGPAARPSAICLEREVASKRPEIIQAPHSVLGDAIRHGLVMREGRGRQGNEVSSKASSLLSSSSVFEWFDGWIPMNGAIGRPCRLFGHRCFGA
eukprot:5322029-Pyramimonas_sp.AAC.1